jgi:hypothetical protein
MIQLVARLAVTVMEAAGSITVTVFVSLPVPPGPVHVIEKLVVTPGRTI